MKVTPYEDQFTSNIWKKMSMPTTGKLARLLLYRYNGICYEVIQRENAQQKNTERKNMRMIPIRADLAAEYNFTGRPVDPRLKRRKHNFSWTDETDFDPSNLPIPTILKRGKVEPMEDDPANADAIVGGAIQTSAAEFTYKGVDPRLERRNRFHRAEAENINPSSSTSLPMASPPIPDGSVDDPFDFQDTANDDTIGEATQNPVVEGLPMDPRKKRQNQSSASHHDSASSNLPTTPIPNSGGDNPILNSANDDVQNATVHSTTDANPTVHPKIEPTDSDVSWLSTIFFNVFGAGPVMEISIDGLQSSLQFMQNNLDHVEASFQAKADRSNKRRKTSTPRQEGPFTRRMRREFEL